MEVSVANILVKWYIPFYTISLFSKSQCRCESAAYDKVVTSSNSAYGVVSSSEDHEYELIELATDKTLITCPPLVTHTSRLLLSFSRTIWTSMCMSSIVM